VSQSLRADVYINVQGDEPLIRPESIRACAEPLLADPNVMMGSVYGECPPEEHDNPAVVKVVTDWQGYALYFSRFAIPYPRNARVDPVKKHVGIYAYRYDVLQAFSLWSPSPLEQTESLEQLRFLEHGVRIKMSLGQGSELAVDTPEQADEVRQILSVEH
jgi:3-deoxy-D-manno-octulosonate cytidylyltransferase